MEVNVKVRCRRRRRRRRSSVALSFVRCRSLSSSSFVAVRCRSLSFVVVRCRSLSFVVVRCRSLSFVVVRCRSLSFVVVRGSSDRRCYRNCSPTAYVIFQPHSPISCGTAKRMTFDIDIHTFAMRMIPLAFCDSAKPHCHKEILSGQTSSVGSKEVFPTVANGIGSFDGGRGRGRAAICW